MPESALFITMDQSKSVDRYAMDTCGIPGEKLMGNAGRKVFEAIRQRYDLTALNGPVWVACGKGNNGGDGFVVALELAQSGVPTVVLCIPDAMDIQGDALTYYTQVIESGIRVIPVNGQNWRTEIDKAGLVVDALLGTGLEGLELREPYAGVVLAINQLSVPIMAVDVPSGISGDAGQMTEPHIQAQFTVTMGYAKAAMLFSPVREAVGEVVVAEIGFPVDSLAHVAGSPLKCLSPAEMSHFYPKRSIAAHKYQAGKVAIIAGSKGFSGAAVLASTAALRSGAGLVRLAVPDSIGAIAETLSLETIVSYAPETASGGFAMAGKSILEGLIDWANILAIGPGIGRAAETIELVTELIPKIDKPLILDADGLFALATNLTCLEHRTTPTILTPHAGEFQNLLDAAGLKMQSNWQSASAFAKRYGCTVLLKGAPSVVATPAGEVFVNSTGNPGMATAGSGDVLTGMIAGLLAQNQTLPGMLNYAMFKHGEAGDLARKKFGELSMIASDIINALPQVLLP